jgi:hypothetical protein
MFAGLLIGQKGWYSKMRKLTWKLKDTKYSRLYCQLAVSELPMKEIESGLLPTPTATNATQGKSSVNNRGKLLLPGIAHRMFSTPTVNNANNSTFSPTEINRDSLVADIMKLLPTVMASDGFKSCATQNQSSLHKEFQTGGDFQLNPQFVAELMGFPSDWLVTPYLAGEENQ